MQRQYFSLEVKTFQENWNDILHCIDAECDYNMFIERYKLYDECIPLRKYKVNMRKIPQSPWITNGVLKSITTKNKLYMEYLRSPKNNKLLNLELIKTHLTIWFENLNENIFILNSKTLVTISKKHGNYILSLDEEKIEVFKVPLERNKLKNLQIQRKYLMPLTPFCRYWTKTSIKNSTNWEKQF